MKKLLTSILLLTSLVVSAQVTGLVKNGAYYDVINNGTIAEVNYLAPLDTLITAATDSLYLDYTHYQSGVNQSRRKILRKNNGRVDLFPTSETIPINTVWRFRTGATNDTIAINPANGYNLIYEGQSTGNAVYINGLYNDGYLEKVATDTLKFTAESFVEYTYGSCTTLPLAANGNTELITSGAGFNVSNTSVPQGTSANQANYINGGTGSIETVTTEYCNTTTALRVTADGTNNGDSAQYYISVTNGVTYDYAILMRGVGGTEAAVRDGSGTNTDFLHENANGNWQLFTGSFVANASGDQYIFSLYADDNDAIPNGYSEYIITVKAQ